MLARLYPTVPKIELNARKRRPGWDHHGTLEFEVELDHPGADELSASIGTFDGPPADLAALQEENAKLKARIEQLEGDGGADDDMPLSTLVRRHIGLAAAYCKDENRWPPLGPKRTRARDRVMVQLDTVFREIGIIAGPPPRKRRSA